MVDGSEQVSDAHMYTIGVDIGGTFTDCSVVDERGKVVVAKVPTTPKDRSQGFFGSLDLAAGTIGLDTGELLRRSQLVVHGTTTGTNAIVSRTGSEVGLLCTAGHEDVMALMRGGGRTAGLPADELLDVPATNKPEPLVPRTRIGGVKERIDVDGEIVAPLDEEQAKEAIRSLLDAGAESIAISLLWAARNPTHEHRLKELVEEVSPGTFVCCATDLVARVGEYERTTSAVVNAYIGPLMVRYIDAIETGLAERGFAGRALFAQCAGGAITGLEAKAAPVRTIDSGPVAGIVSTKMLADRTGEPNVIAADMGGTTFDVSVISSGVALEREIQMVQRYEMAIPALDIESVGAGGGSVAWVDDSDRLNVGPRSAGAEPGPASYGKGGEEPTVTDADVVLGVIAPETFLDGRMSLDPALAAAAVDRVAERIGLGTAETAAGINRIVDSKMADLIRRMSLMRGLDPRRFVCFAYGGGGPVHAAAVAREIGIPRVLVPIPRAGAVWSALGAAASDVTHVYQTARELPLPADPAEIADIFATMEKDARATLDDEGFGDSRLDLRRSVRMKFTMQVHDVEVPITDGPLDADSSEALEERFVTTYEGLYGAGSGYREGGAQITSFQVRATAALPPVEFAEELSPVGEERSTRRVYWSELGEFVETPVLRLAGGAIAGETFSGPHLIEFPDTVVVVRPGMSARFDDGANIVIDIESTTQGGS